MEIAFSIQNLYQLSLIDTNLISITLLLHSYSHTLFMLLLPKILSLYIQMEQKGWIWNNCCLTDLTWDIRLFLPTLSFCQLLDWNLHHRIPLLLGLLFCIFYSFTGKGFIEFIDHFKEQDFGDFSNSFPVFFLLIFCSYFYWFNSDSIKLNDNLL